MAFHGFELCVPFSCILVQSEVVLCFWSSLLIGGFIPFPSYPFGLYSRCCLIIYHVHFICLICFHFSFCFLIIILIPFIFYVYCICLGCSILVFSFFRAQAPKVRCLRCPWRPRPYCVRRILLFLKDLAKIAPPFAESRVAVI